MYGQPTFGFNLRLTPVVKKLLIANGVVFFATLLAPSLVGYLAFRPDALITQFWGVFTYMFVHADFMHLFVNMLVLFFFGPPLESRWGGQEFIRYYVVAALGGVVLQFAFGGAGMMVGASAACYGLMLAFAMNWPDTPIYIYAIFPVKAKWLVAFLGVMTLLSSFGSSGGGVAHFAHLGGLVAGLIYLKADWRPRQMARSVSGKTKSRKRRLAIVPREEIEKRAAAKGRTMSEGDERKMLDEVDRVLDKISEQGMASLTEEERRLLDEVSRKHRTN